MNSCLAKLPRNINRVSASSSSVVHSESTGRLLLAFAGVGDGKKDKGVWGQGRTWFVSQTVNCERKNC